MPRGLCSFKKIPGKCNVAFMVAKKDFALQLHTYTSQELQISGSYCDNLGSDASNVLKVFLMQMKADMKT